MSFPVSWRYLHEVCQPPVVHKNFMSANILLDDELTIRVSDSGLAPLLSSDSIAQVTLLMTFQNIAYWKIIWFIVNRFPRAFVLMPTNPILSSSLPCQGTNDCFPPSVITFLYPSIKSCQVDWIFHVGN